MLLRINNNLMQYFYLSVFLCSCMCIFGSNNFDFIIYRSLGYDRNSTLFYTGDSPSVNITRDLIVTNTFNFTLVIYNITLGEEMLDYFSVSSIMCE